MFGSEWSHHMDVRLRENAKLNDIKENEILDQDQQQQIIDELEADYRKMVKTQKYVFSGAAIFAGVMSFVVGFIYGVNVPFIAVGLSCFALLLCQTHKRRLSFFAWLSAGIIEVMALILAFFYRNQLNGLIILMHVIYGLLLIFHRTSQTFFKSVPAKIQELYNLKYGAKLA